MDAGRRACVGFDLRKVVPERQRAAQGSTESFQKLPNVPKYRDFRKMLQEKNKQIDALIIATPDNTHAVITTTAMKMG